MNQNNIVVLMATYNGHEYLRQQIDSVLEQTVDNLTLLIRDDGSTDDTVDIVREYMARDSRVQLLPNRGQRLGAIGNFFQLLKEAPEAEYYALCDQDDYWDSNKLSVAIDRLKGETAPMLYCCAKEIVDEKLDTLYTNSYHNPRLAWGNAMVENMCTGCTAVFNHSLRCKVLQGIPEYTVMHDWWIYMVAVALGSVYYDEKPYIKYRQHGSNEYGEITGRLALWRYRLGQLFSKRGHTYHQLQEFLRLYGNQMDMEDVLLSKRLLATRTNMIARIGMLRSGLVYRQTASDNRIVRLLILLGKL